MNRPNHISEAEWNSMSLRAKKRAVREANPAPARDPKEVYAEKLESLGGRRWQKNGKDRVYFNDVWVNVDLSADTGAITTGYYDVQAEAWVIADSSVTPDAFYAAILNK